MGWRSGGLGIAMLFPRLAAVLLILAIAHPTGVRSAPVDPSAARGKAVLFVFNKTKLEKVRAAVPADAARIASLETWRKNDLDIAAYLQSLGFKVTQVDEHAPPAATAGQDLIVISETVDTIEIGTKYRDVPIPIVNFENPLLGPLEMSDLKSGRDFGTEEGQRFLWIVNAPHPLAAGLAAGTQNVLTDEHYKMSWGRPGPGADTIATLLGEPEKATIFAYEKGATMHDEFLAPARRVSFFLWQDGFDGLRPEGQALLRAAVLWAVTPPE